MSDSDLAYLRRQVEQGNVVLFTGAGFSISANDMQGRSLPLGNAFARGLCALCYPGEPYDESSVQDMFEQSQRRQGRKLAESISERFTVDATTLPDFYRVWFSLPWARIYALNVDDLGPAVQRKNGLAADGPSKITFSQDQYAQRIARQELSMRD